VTCQHLARAGTLRSAKVAVFSRRAAGLNALDDYMKFLRCCAEKFAAEYIVVSLVTDLKPGDAV
jgi:hypothetical protein